MLIVWQATSAKLGVIKKKRKVKYIRSAPRTNVKTYTVSRKDLTVTSHYLCASSWQPCSYKLVINSAAYNKIPPGGTSKTYKNQNGRWAYQNFVCSDAREGQRIVHTKNLCNTGIQIGRLGQGYTHTDFTTSQTCNKSYKLCNPS